MSLLPILTAPHPVLSMKARTVESEEFGEALAKLVSDMAETMYAAPGVGLAAPQVGDSRRIIVVDPGNTEQSTAHLYRMVNPTIVKRSKEMILWPETCLSVPELEVNVKRHQIITVEWQNPTDGSPQSKEFRDFEAVILQHEIDHLDGTVLLDKASGFRKKRYLKKAQRAKATV